ncbi:hypothetical protein NPIL_424711 [Nephila pilipes]|uniref:Uncharacterized protein n=1 Tax=Nephila pilipes TaxID=299642 RepID=A0A8X6JAI9_NEPPI|nr:hypothetical protein NPIL_424711 [Nephila pilipes]
MLSFRYPKETSEDIRELQKKFEHSNVENKKSMLSNEDSKEVLGFLNQFKKGTSSEKIENEIEKTVPKKYKTVIKEIIDFIQKHREEMYWTLDRANDRWENYTKY